MPFFENIGRKKGRDMSTQGSIRVESKTRYTIEVNDKGETISFDLADFRLTAKLLNVYNRLEELGKQCEEEGKRMLEKEDKVAKKIKTTDESNNKIEGLVTQNMLDTMELANDYYNKARDILDEFLGEGACQKIFGDTNYATMFDDLFEQLEPHFKKMGINYQKLQKGLAKKFAPKNLTVMK